MANLSRGSVSFATSNRVLLLVRASGDLYTRTNAVPRTRVLSLVVSVQFDA